MAHTHTAEKSSSFKILMIAILVTGLFAIIEALTGWLANSLTLMGDAGHMVADTISLGIAATAAWIATRPPSQDKTYGFSRVEVIAALISGLLLLGIVVAIVLEAFEHLRTPEVVQGNMVITIGLIGLFANLFVAWILHRGESNINTKAALLHVISDILGSVAAVLAGTIIYFTNWMPIDPILSLFISILILRSTVRLLKKSLHILMEGTPENIKIDEVSSAISAIPKIKSVHDLHIWALTSEKALLSAHVVIDDLNEWKSIFPAIKTLLQENYDINHITIQPETLNFPSECPEQCST